MFNISDIFLDLKWDEQKGIVCATSSDRTNTPFREYVQARDACLNDHDCEGFQNDCGQNDAFYLCYSKPLHTSTSKCGSIVYTLKGKIIIITRSKILHLSNFFLFIFIQIIYKIYYFCRAFQTHRKRSYMLKHRFDSFV